jgi:hypothetical protein
MNEELTKLMTDSYDQGVKDALESVKEGLDALPKREWVGLTDEEIDEGNRQSWVSKQAWQSAVWWASEKLKEKNT